MAILTERSAAPEALPLPAHPLEPLSPEEVAAASAVISSDPRFPAGARFVFLQVAEPAKAELAAWSPGNAWDRAVEAVVRSPLERATYEAVASLTSGAVTGWREVPAAQPPMTEEEFTACEALVRADPRWQEAVRARGVEDLELVMLDPWASGHLGPEDDPALRRIARPLSFVRAHPDDNGYARPVEGLVVTVDLDLMEVVDVVDHGVVPLPERSGNWEASLLSPDGVPAVPREAVRQPLRPISITQPEGPSFTVDGHAVSWASWRLRVGFTPREGLVLHEVGYVDPFSGALRPVLHRASMCEMYVPYGDPRPTHAMKNVFDEGEYGLGWLANPLELGCDCLGEIFYFDGVVNDQDGQPVVIPNAVCMHEEDASIAWKHTDFRTGRSEVRRNRRLVISTIATVGNYDYGFYWHLYLDGSIEFEVKLTGILSTGALPVGQDPVWGTTVAPGLMAPNHEHYFSVRLDTCVDGPRNNLVEVESVADPAGPDNPSGNAWRAVRTHLTSESAAARETSGATGRSWLVESADTTSALGARPAYRVEPGPWTRPLWQEGSQQARRGGFATKALWATPHDPAERYAAGTYVAQNPGPDGLVAYTAQDRSLVDADLVLWCTLGAHHVVRPEDWPVMPVTKVSLHLKPFGFFDGNPVLDLPAERPAGHATAPAGSPAGSPAGAGCCSGVSDPAGS